MMMMSCKNTMLLHIRGISAVSYLSLRRVLENYSELAETDLVVLSRNHSEDTERSPTSFSITQ
jgi:hypothetical protein